VAIQAACGLEPVTAPAGGLIFPRDARALRRSTVFLDQAVPRSRRPRPSPSFCPLTSGSHRSNERKFFLEDFLKSRIGNPPHRAVPEWPTARGHTEAPHAAVRSNDGFASVAAQARPGMLRTNDFKNGFDQIGFSVSVVFSRGCLDPRSEIHVARTPSSRVEMPVGAAGHWRGIGGELFDQINHLGALRGRKPDESSQKPQALDRFAGWMSELLAQFRSECAIGHLALFSGSTLAVRSTSELAKLKLCQGTTPPARQTAVDDCGIRTGESDTCCGTRRKIHFRFHRNR